ncbi:dTDP-glucose 4,6-dehydratase [Candidatus Pacearchaeota archaeon]|nr:dTDP-glucose 4,6-dehydratase [Candidatus Pacearchaeota archaeon]|tara:strand:+ start:3786 stop:4781 length:996 start_codon:yes stop_codon:yes gene_type:complete
MNLLITGGCGFIGSNFVNLAIKKRSAVKRIVILDSLTYAGDYANIKDAVDDHHKVSHENVDLKDERYVNAVFEKYKISHVMHFAAETHVDNSISSPRPFVNSNIIGSFNLLEACREYGIERYHHISTDEVYGELGEKGSFSEDTPYAPRNPYAASKAASDHMVRAFFHTYDLPVTLSNCSNNYGPSQHKEKFIPVVINSILSRKKIPVYGEGRNVRDWIYVEDHCHALWAILTKGTLGETYNVGANNEKTNLQIIYDICKGLKVEPEDCVEFVEDRLGHDFRYAINNSKITKELKWKPRYSFEKGLVKTITHYKSMYDTEFRDLADQCDHE